MKKTLIFIPVALFSVFTLKAQTQKGDQLLGGSVDFTSITNQTTYNQLSAAGNNNKVKSTSLGIGPSYSYFIAHNVDLGVSLGYTNQKTTYTYPVNNSTGLDNTTANIFSGAVYLRKYFLYNNKIGIRTGPFAQYQYTKNQSEYTPSVNNNTQKGYNIGGGVDLDLVYFPTKRLGITAAIAAVDYDYSDVKQENDYHETGNLFGLSVIGSGLTFSVFYAFGR